MNKLNKIKSVRIKIIIYFIILIIVTQGFFYLFSNLIIFKSYSILENKYVELNLKRIDNVVQDNFKQQKLKLKDWSIWDDTYNFIKNKNNDYIVKNLLADSLFNLNVNSLTFVNNSGEIVYDKLIDIATNKELDKSTLELNLKKYILDKNYDPKLYVQGLINTDYGIMYVSSGPIYRSDGTGPIVGTLIVGNILNKDIINGISDNILYQVDIQTYNSINNKQDFIDAQNKLLKLGSNAYITIFEDSVIGYSLLYDLDNKPIAITKISIPRDFYNQSKNDYKLFTEIMILILVLFSLCTMLIFERLIIRRLLKLNNEISKINETKDLNERITSTQNDEIGNIKNVINMMLGDLQKSQKNERDNINSERTFIENEKKQNSEIKKMNELMVGRELEMIELKKEINQLKKNIK